ncbi:hypothetical protein F5884DRAFT_419704 [Xylogone sp. PMI_703]|nr:hypothetical protein F5884DRAFT_419704 [Xylogone sp. PMI_703]
MGNWDVRCDDCLEDVQVYKYSFSFLLKHKIPQSRAFLKLLHKAKQLANPPSFRTILQILFSFFLINHIHKSSKMQFKAAAATALALAVLGANAAPQILPPGIIPGGGSLPTPPVGGALPTPPIGGSLPTPPITPPFGNGSVPSSVPTPPGSSPSSTPSGAPGVPGGNPGDAISALLKEILGLVTGLLQALEQL